MHYRKLQADSIFDGERLLHNQVLVLAADDSIEAVIPASEAGEAVQSFEGILTPGLINCHCHLELSHLKGIIEPGTGLVDFLLGVIEARRGPAIGMQEAMASAEAELYRQGVSGVADISNTTESVALKKDSRIRWHNLVEVINFKDEDAKEKLETYSAICKHYQQQNLPSVLAPHAPYTVNEATLKWINEKTAGEIISIHNQESNAENELFVNGSGAFLKLYKQVGGGLNPFAVSHKSSLKTWLPHFTNGQTILMVHNTFINEEDLLFAREHEKKYGLQLLYCLCANANMYIESCLPPIDLLLQYNCSIVLGTDSYSSNWQLNLASEMNTIRKNYPSITLEMMLGWVTSHAATAMRWNDLGAFERGRKPGVVLINFNEGALESTRII